MGAQRTATAYLTGNNLGASITVVTALTLRYSGMVGIQVVIDNGSGGVPSDSPLGTWRLWGSNDGTNWAEFVDAETTAELSNIALIGTGYLTGTKVSAFATFVNVPSLYVKLTYTRTSGGGGNSSCDVIIVTW